MAMLPVNLHCSLMRGWLPQCGAEWLVRPFPLQCCQIRWRGCLQGQASECNTSHHALATSAPAEAAWNGSASQQQLMQADQCILVDNQDSITGHASKHDAHRFLPQQPHGLLHRAFSVFLFNSEDKLLLQQRANSKITFPGVWTNTCCSHPLYAQDPCEVDQPHAVQDGTVLGAKRAAVRKLGHELGIPAEQLPLAAFKYLSRLHYCAADVKTWGPQAEWGEHEIDYILFLRADVSLEHNVEEVDAAKYVSLPELRSMMADPSLLWSPWFRIIADNLLHQWWQDLDRTLFTNDFVDLRSIHTLDSLSK